MSTNCKALLHLLLVLICIRMESDSNQDIEASFKKLIDDNNIVIFSKTTCPFCRKVKKLFEDLNQEFHTFELDKYSTAKCAQMQDILQAMTGQRTVPNVFIHQRHIGGCTDTQKALADGSLHDMIDGTFQEFDYDYFVIGGGSGGLASAKEAASYKKKVGLSDFVAPSPKGTTWGLGGTCVNVGCIPKKLMHAAAIMGETIQDSVHFGWSTDKKEHSWVDMVENVQNHVHSLNFMYRKNLREKNVTYYNALAKFQDNHTLMLYGKDGKLETTVTAQNFLLAMGCRPSYPEFPGAKEHCITSDDVFSLLEPPGKTLIVGASYIALETAGFLAGLGIPVTVMVRSILLRGFDQEIANKIGENLEAHGVEFLTNHVPHSVSRLSADELLVISKNTVDDSLNEAKYKTVLLAIGRVPCTKELGLEEIGVRLNEHDDRVVVNKYGQTNIRNIFAVGDIIEEKFQLTPVAIQAGKILAQRLYGMKTNVFDYMMVPTTVFTPLEYGCVGYSEELAYKTFGKEEIEIYHVNFTPLEWEVQSRNKNKAFGKLVCLKKEKERVVGFHYLGPNAGEVTQGFALSLKLGATKEDFDNLIGIHPTCAEVFTSMTITKASGKSATAGAC